jgi:hypothetical protein
MLAIKSFVVMEVVVVVVDVVVVVADGDVSGGSQCAVAEA